MKKKVLLMGKDGAGKTSMYSVIFANYIAKDTCQLAATIDIEKTDIHFLGDLVLNIWDCGGQKAFLKSYYGNRTAVVFKDIMALVYVFDIGSRELEEDIRCYQTCLEAVLHYSPAANVFCLIHKMDLIQEDKRDLIFRQREEQLQHLSRPVECHCFPTSIWDESLYNAWSSVVHTLVPNMQQIDGTIEEFCKILDADEVLLFEGATVLIISHYQLRTHHDQHRFEKISNIIKQFKLTCSKFSAKFNSMQVTTNQFSLFIESYPSNTYLMVIMSDCSIASSAILINIKSARRHFGTLEGLRQDSAVFIKKDETTLQL